MEIWARYRGVRCHVDSTKKHRTKRTVIDRQKRGKTSRCCLYETILNGSRTARSTCIHAKRLTSPCQPTSNSPKPQLGSMRGSFGTRRDCQDSEQGLPPLDAVACNFIGLGDTRSCAVKYRSTRTCLCF